MAEHDTSNQVIVAEGVFTWPSSAPQLIGSFFPESGVSVFPASASCPKTSSRVVEEVLLPRHGTLWSWTIQGFPPKNPPYIGTESPKDFVPYGVGYVQLAEQVIVEQTTQFFGMKIQRYTHQHGITRSTLAKVAVKNFANGSLNDNAWRRKPMSEDEVLNATMLSEPSTQYMFCSPGEGGVALVLCRGDLARDYPARPVFLKSAVLRSRPFGSFEVFNS